MKKALILTAIGAALLFRFLKNKITTAVNLDYKIKRVDVLWVGIIPSIKVFIELINTESTDLFITEIDADIYANGSINIGRSNLQNIIIKANAVSEVSFIINTIPTGLLKTIMELIYNKKLSIKIVGTINTLNVTIPFELNKNVF